MEILAAFATVGAGILIGVIARYYYTLNKANCAVVSFDEFEKVFNIAPNKYEREYSSFLIHYDTDPGDRDSTIYRIRINSFFGYIKTIRLFNKRNKRNNNSRSLKVKQKLCEQWKKDVEEYKKNAINDMTRQLRNNSVAIFSEGQEAIIRAAVEQICKDLGQNNETAKKAAEKAISTITIEAVANG